MLAQRSMQAALRRAALQRPLAITSQQTRLSTTLSPGEPGTKPGVSGGPSPQLVEQRLRRPTSPHLGIYQPQITWYLSSLNRITGSVLSGGFYIFGFGYLVSPLFGLHAFESATMAAAVGGMGLASKFALKLGLALPFTFHSFNGIRHLVWDTGSQLSNKQVQVTGWTVAGISVVSAAYLASIGTFF